MSRYEIIKGAVRVKPLARGYRIAADLTPETARQHVAGLMADGRERTSNDVALRLKMPRGQASAALGWLYERGILTGEDYGGTGGSTIRIYRKAGTS